MGVCNCSMFCFALLYVHSSIAIILMGKRRLVALLNLSSWCLMMVERLFLAVPRGCLQFVIVVFPDHTHLLFMVFVILCQGTPEGSTGSVSGFKASQATGLKSHPTDWEKPGIEPATPGLQDIGLSPTPQRFLITHRNTLQTNKKNNNISVYK